MLGPATESDEPRCPIDRSTIRPSCVAVLEATLLLEADLDLSDALRHVLEEARAMTNARFGAIGVLDEEGTALSEFLTAGLDDEAERQIGARPSGKGVLGTLITHPQPIRIASIDAHPDSYGFPPHHPPMQSFLGVPIRVRDAVFGNLYLTDKIGWSEFTEDDEALVGALAVAAGIAIENARLHEQVGRAAVFDDRDRLARELHDSIIQRLFGVGLTLQGVASSGISPSKERRITSAIADIDETIRQIRTTIYGLSLIDEGETARALHPVAGRRTAGHRLVSPGAHLRRGGGRPDRSDDPRPAPADAAGGGDEHRTACGGEPGRPSRCPPRTAGADWRSPTTAWDSHRRVRRRIRTHQHAPPGGKAPRHLRRSAPREDGGTVLTWAVPLNA